VAGSARRRETSSDDGRFRRGSPNPTAKLQALVAESTTLDGVRVDAGAEFVRRGELLLAGVPGLNADAQRNLPLRFRPC